MIAKESQLEQYCKKFKKIENYYEALNSPENYYCHHRLGLYLPASILRTSNRYFNVDYKDLVFISASDHQFIHKFTNTYKYNTNVMNLVKRYEKELPTYNSFIQYLKNWDELLKLTKI